MPDSIRTAVSDILNSVGNFFKSLGDRFYDAADWAYDIPAIGPYIASALYSVVQYCYNIYTLFNNLRSGWLNLCDWLDAVWAKFGDIWADLGDLWNYAQITLKNLVNDALGLAGDAWDYAVTAYNKARDAWNYATDYLKDLVTSAYNKAVWAYEQIAAAVTAKAQEIYAWVKGIPAEIKAFVDGVVATVKSWATGAIDDAKAWILSTLAAPINLINLWFDAIQGFFNDPWGWLVDKFTDWFLGPEK